MSLACALLPLAAPVAGRMRFLFPSVLAMAVASVLHPPFVTLWVTAHSGNANFVFATSLLHSGGLALLLWDLCTCAAPAGRGAPSP